MQPRQFIDFGAVNRVALPYLPDLCARWLPDGRRRGHEYVARNPLRADQHPGSFSVQTQPAYLNEASH